MRHLSPALTINSRVELDIALIFPPIFSAPHHTRQDELNIAPLPPDCLMSATPSSGAQGATDYASMTLQQITDATEDRYMNSVSDNVGESNVDRRTSVDFFGGSSFSAEYSLFGLRSSFSFGSSDHSWSAVNKAKEIREQSAPKVVLGLGRTESFSSTFTGMTGDELADEVDPWASATTDSRFDFGFSSALRDSCMYNVPREFLPSDDESDVDQSDEDSEFDHGDLMETDTEGEDMEGDFSDSETVCSDDPGPVSELPTVLIRATAQPNSPPAVDSEILTAAWVPGEWAPTTPVRITAPFPRRSARIPRLTPVKQTESQSPTKRKRPAAKRQNITPSKKVAFVGKADKPIARAPKTGPTSKSPKVKQAPTVRVRRVILRV
ncbi:hypothetical protein B0H16DRAFT_1854445 [Mycena metata]|uniref:Uncharacterized protein n=1 Tax=Mycena metata TaxID=1033252 RepID=A0AAD7IP17_9AGAR|nr:hypothetical protein B0H16DRAFT_1854445 [Mycena metata]